MPKPIKQAEEKEQLLTSQYYRDLARDYYNEAYDMEEVGSSEQAKIDNLWGAAGMNFCMAFSLGRKEAPFGLFKCFALGAGVEKDSILSTYMYGVAKKLEDADCTKVPEEYLPTIDEYMKPAIDQIADLVLNTQKKFPNGTDAGELIAQMNAYQEKIGLWTRKLMYTAFLSKEGAKKSIIKFHADHPGWKYLGLGDDKEFADPVDDVGAAAAGVAALHFDDYHG